MKNTNKVANFDAIVEARKDKNYPLYLRGASLRLRLADEIYNAREIKGLSQQVLAKNIFSTQKVISRIENGEVNIGIELLDRLSEELDFNTNNLVRIFNHIELDNKIEIKLPKSQYATKVGTRFWNSNLIANPQGIFQGFVKILA